MIVVALVLVLGVILFGFVLLAGDLGERYARTKNPWLILTAVVLCFATVVGAFAAGVQVGEWFG